MIYSNRNAVYLYCVTHPVALDLPAVAGVQDDVPVSLESQDSLMAVYSRVPLEMFTGISAEQNMKNIDWIGPRAIRHEKVIERVMQEGPVYPVRFATLFSSMDALWKTLMLNSELISDFLDQTRHKHEFSVKGFLDKKKIGTFLTGTEFKDQKNHLDTLSPGKKYIAEQQFKKQLDIGIKKWTQKTRGEFISHLAEKNNRFSARKIVTEKNNKPEMVFNLAFLIHSKHRASFLRKISEAAASFLPMGLAINVSGPWPPYSFCQTIEWET
jgi:hypothetical protein